MRVPTDNLQPLPGEQPSDTSIAMAQATQLQLNESRDDLENRRAQEGQSSFIGRMLYGSSYGDPQARPSREERKFPGEEEVAQSKKVDQTYGDPSAGFTEPGAKLRQIPLRSAPMFLNEGSTRDVKTTTIDRAQADELHKAWLGAQKSPVAALGFDPRRTVASPPSEDKLTVGGTYSGKKDEMWYDRNYQSSIVHESMHRGIEMLRKEGLLPKNMPKEEYIVRGLMSRYFGDIEKEGGKAGAAQVETAQKLISKKDLDEIEAAATQLYAKKRGRGPA